MPHKYNNIPPGIKSKIGRDLFLQENNHPLATLKRRIETFFAQGYIPGSTFFKCFDRLPQVVSVQQNFDDLLTPKDHPSRQLSDTYYVNDKMLLRCHMTAHQTTLLKEGHTAFLMVGDVYRRDEVDATHYPVFHQMDGVRVWDRYELPPTIQADLEKGNRDSAVVFVMDDLKLHLSALVKDLFGSDIELRWVETTFPFTEPSLELEIYWEGQWLEVLGCGMIRDEILKNCEKSNTIGWAFGIGLERIAMVLHDIPDIRLFWTDDNRFMKQFQVQSDKPVKFVPYSKHPACYKDISFWLPSEDSETTNFHDNDFFSLAREAAGDLVESIQLIDSFVHPKTRRKSVCYRILYRSMDRNLTNAEVDEIQDRIKASVVSSIVGSELR